MKREAKGRLIKDIIIAVVSWLVFGIVFAYGCGIGGFGFLVSLVMAGVPFGWKWMSKVFVALSFNTIVVKFFLSMFIGWFAIFVVIIKDIVDLSNAEY